MWYYVASFVAGFFLGILGLSIMALGHRSGLIDDAERWRALTKEMGNGK